MIPSARQVGRSGVPPRAYTERTGRHPSRRQGAFRIGFGPALASSGPLGRPPICSFPYRRETLRNPSREASAMGDIGQPLRKIEVMPIETPLLPTNPTPEPIAPAIPAREPARSKA